jgi:hypothetical protein
MTRIHIYSYGRNLGSKYYFKRYYQVNVDYTVESPSNNHLENIINANNTLVNTWSPLPPHIEKTYGFDMLTYVERLWWVEYKQCKMCKRHYEIALQKWKRNVVQIRSPDIKHTLCFRHYVVKHISEINHAIDNKFREVTITPEYAIARIITDNYDYNIDADRNKAIMHINYKGKGYTFTYNNHVNAFPYASSYDMILSGLFEMLRQYVIIISRVLNNERQQYNVKLVINGEKHEIKAEEQW